MASLVATSSMLLLCLPLSIVKDVEEALVELLLPQLAFSCDSDDHETLVRSRIHIDELAFLWLEVGLSCTFWVLCSLVQLISHGHVHLDFDSRQVDMVIFITHHEILVTVMPEQGVRLHFDELVGRGGRVALSIVLEALEMVKLYGDDAARLWVLDLKGAVEDTDLQPMVTIKLRDKISRLVAEGELLAVSREHDLGDVNAEKLPLLGLAQTIEQDVIDGTFLAADDSFTTILVKVHRLILHVDLLFQLQVALTEDEDFPFKSDIDV